MKYLLYWLICLQPPCSPAKQSVVLMVASNVQGVAKSVCHDCDVKQQTQTRYNQSHFNKQ